MAPAVVRAIADLPDVCQLRILSLLEDRPEQPLKERCSLDTKDSAPALTPLIPVKADTGASKLADEGMVVGAIEELNSKGVALIEGALLHELVVALRTCAERALERDLTAAKMGGRSETQWEDQQYRGDLRMWLTPTLVAQPGWDSFRALTQLLLRLHQPLERAGYNVSGPVSFQLACYPGNGFGYVRHRDRSPSSPTRTVTILCYLNPDWSPGDGGELRLLTPSEELVQVAPLGGTVVLFESGLEHEVLPTQAKRFAVTAWFSEGRKDDRKDAPADCDGSQGNGQESKHLESNSQNRESDKEGSPLEVETDVRTVSSCPTSTSETPFENTPKPSSPSHGSCQPHPCPGIPLGAPRIFVSIACFRDSECRWTVKDLFRKADAPERLFVGVVWQIDEQDDREFAHLRGLDVEFRTHVREIRTDWRTATGPCRARHLAQQLWRGEEYFLQIDSHMRFAPHWDTKLMSALTSAEQLSPKAVISSYPPPYEGLGPAASIAEDSQPTLLYAKEFGPEGLLRVSGRRGKFEGGAPVRSAFWAAGFSFSRSALIREVPYCPHLPELFFGEEMIMAVRFFTHGWDVYPPPEALVFHLWSREHRPFFRESREPDALARVASEQQVRSFLCTERREGEEVCGVCRAPAAETYGAEYGLGTVRTPKEFADACSVNFCRRWMAGKTDPEEGSKCRECESPIDCG